MKLQARTALLLSVVAIVAALTGVGSTLASQRLISGKQIKNNTITTEDLKNDGIKSADLGTASVGAAAIAPASIGSEEIATNAVGSTAIAPNAVGSEEIANGSVHSADIGANQVTSEDVELPEPEQIVEPPAPTDMVGTEFTLVDDVGSYTKEDPTSKLQVAWTGSASAGFSPCQFQLRVDGQVAASGAGVVYLQNSSVLSVSDVALFEGLGTGAHEVQVYARATQAGSAFPCTVGPEQAGVDQTFVVTEEVG